MITVAGFAVTVLLILRLNGRKDKDEKKAEEIIAPVEETVETDPVEEALKADPYGAELAALYQDSPEVEKLILNRQDYPDWLVEYLLRHLEAVEWVLGYPEAMQKTTEGEDETVPIEVNLRDYQIRNRIPLYLQWDLAWGYDAYGSGTIAVDGCGPTCLSMVATGLTGDTSLTPKRVADFSVQQGYYTDDSVTDWNLMQAGASSLGLKVIQIGTWSKSAILEQLRAGNPMICSMGPGDFTSQGHFIVLVGVTEDGSVIVNDPNSRVNSRKKWDAQELLDQMKAMWAYTVAE